MPPIFSPLKAHKNAVMWNVWGVLILLLGTALTAVSNAFLHLSPHLPASQILFIKCAIALLCVVFVMAFKNINSFKQVLLSNCKGQHLFRAGIGAIGNYFWILSLQHLPFSKATVLSLASALLGPIGAWFYLKEKLRPTTIAAIMLGFIGIYIILSPSFKEMGITWVLFFPLISALCFSISTVMIKSIALNDDEGTALVWLLLGMAICAIPFTIYNWVSLTANDWYILISLGIIYAVVQWTLISAYTYATAAFLSPFKFVRLPIGLIISALWFHEAMSASLLAGAGLILFACLWGQRVKADPSAQFSALYRVLK